MTSLQDVIRHLRTYKGGPGSGNFGHSGRPGKRGGSSSGGVSMFGLQLPKSKTPVEIHVVDSMNYDQEARKILDDPLFSMGASSPAIYVNTGDKGYILLKEGRGDNKETLAEEYGHHLDKEAGKNSWGGGKSGDGAYSEIMKKADAAGEIRGDYQRYNPAEFAADAFAQYTLADDKQAWAKVNPNMYKAYQKVVDHL